MDRSRLADMLLVAAAIVLVSGAAVASAADLRGPDHTAGGAVDGSGGAEKANPLVEAIPVRRGGANAKTVSTIGPPSAFPRERLVIHGTGDVNLDPGYIPALSTQGDEYAWSGLGGLFLDDDVTVINLECAPSDLGARVPKQFNFRCATEALGVARTSGVEVANLANNHGGDYGMDAWLDGRTELERAGIQPVGVGADLDASIEPAIVEVGGWRVAVVGLGGVIPNEGWLAGPDKPGMPSGDDIPTMVAAVERAAAVSDLVVVTIHWGAELDTQPRQEDRERAEAMIEAGADVIFGHHAHRLQPMETVDGAAVAWGLGNFVWPAFSAAGSDTAVARVVVEPDRTIVSCLLPVTIVASGHPTLDDPTTRTCPDE